MNKPTNFELEQSRLRQFETNWRAIGWWAETWSSEGRWNIQFGAELFSPTHLASMLEEDHKDSIENWHKSSSYFRSDNPPEISTYPSRFYMDERNWVVGDTAIKACGGAILIAKRLYPDQMLTGREFHQKLQGTRQQPTS